MKQNSLSSISVCSYSAILLPIYLSPQALNNRYMYLSSAFISLIRSEIALMLCVNFHLRLLI